MQWAIQNSGISFAALDRNVEPLVKAIDEKGDTRIAVGVIPFTDIIAGIEAVDSTIPTMFYGSTRLVEIAENLSYKPGVFFNKEWFSPKNWVGKRPDLLNEKQTYSTVGELRKSWITKPTFIKSIDPKVLTGLVWEAETDKNIWLDEYTHLKDEDELVLSPVQNITQEWRFFIISGKIVTGSQYKHDGILRWREPISDEVWKQARRMVQDWLPSPNIVMDICKLKSGEFKVVEFNATNCSGFYASPIAPWLKAIDDIA